jgi:hypothetical protein
MHGTVHAQYKIHNSNCGTAQLTRSINQSVGQSVNDIESSPEPEQGTSLL